VLKDSLSTEEQKVSARNSLNEISEEVKVYHNTIIDENEGTTLSTILRAQRNIEIPEAVKDDENQRFKYYREHYWDNFDLSNDVLIRVPESMYRTKMEAYLDKLYMQTPDSIKKGIETLILSAQVNPETYKYVVWNLCLKYQTPKIMGQDEIFIYLYDTYFETGEMDYWANESLKKNLKERADQLRKSLVGAKAPNMILLDNNLQRVALYDITKKYTIIYFFDPDCGHCKKETPKLNSFYKTTKHNVEVYAVSADTSMVKMNNYIKEYGLNWISANGPRTITPHYQTMYDANTTPTIYVLDEKKKIIAKKLEAEQLEEFLTNYEKFKN
jgi:peroxiredoxin